MEIMFASLCRRASRADSSLQQSAQRTPRRRFAAIASPLPDPPSTTPRSQRPSGDGFSRRTDEVRIIHGLVRKRPEVFDVVAERPQTIGDHGLVTESCVV